MPGGGIISGGAMFGDPTKMPNPAASVIIPTMVQIAEDVLNQFVGLTCVFDRNWVNRPGDPASLPLGFFYVKDIAETSETEIHDQVVMIYEPQAQFSAEQLSSQLRPGVQEVIADNAILKPKSYQLDLVLPFKVNGGLFTRQLADLGGMFDAFVEIFGGDVGYQSWFGAANTVLGLANTVVDSMARLPGNASAAYINKNSLDMMWKNKHIVTMKMWTGYDYVFGMITGLDTKKVGVEDDVFRTVMKFREIPVLSINPAAGVTTPSTLPRSILTRAISVQNRLLVEPMIQLTGVDQASGGGIDLSSLDF